MPADAAAILIDDPSAFGLRVLDQCRHVIGLAGLRQRRDVDALLPRHADLELAHLLAEPAQERLGDGLMHDQHLQRRAALAVERQGSDQAFLDRKLEIGVRQNDGGVLGVEPENGPQAVAPSGAAS